MEDVGHLTLEVARGTNLISKLIAVHDSERRKAQQGSREHRNKISKSEFLKRTARSEIRSADQLLDDCQIVNDQNLATLDEARQRIDRLSGNIPGSRACLVNSLSEMKMLAEISKEWNQAENLRYLLEESLAL
ncbi:hypothetical protein JCGZ_05554 [Jatropha curcas]|uniref:Uncharacterized protein n=1 Tax=Jatropha curcas TaxID=180498 RepID=A0A067L6N0_JATCU|nr:hypothetical protein JCGZ_05554 [Jatropha curcas]